MENSQNLAVALNNDDLNYNGSRFMEVRNAIFENPYRQTWGNPDAPSLPVYKINLFLVLKGILSLGKRWLFLKASERTIDSRADLRWGTNRQGFRRLLHPNGICLAGTWEITAETPYSGYFKKGSKALIIGRYSTCCENTKRGSTRSLSLVGKLYPTVDPKHTQPLKTGNFFTQQDLGGDFTDYINDAELRNAPDTRSWRRGFGLLVFLLEGIAFTLADKKPSQRQLYEISELGKTASETIKTPMFMRLRVKPDQARIEGETLDFRDEIMAHIYDKGDTTPKRGLTFTIEVSDSGITRGLPIYERRIINNWKTIGEIKFTEAVASYNGDFVIHFNHPSWRSDQNNPESATRINNRKV